MKNITIWSIDIIDKEDKTVCDHKLFFRKKDAERWMEENRVKYSEAGFTMSLGGEPLWIGRE